MEQWKPIDENPNYEVSSMGNVRRVGKEVVLKKMENSGGRYCIDLGRDMKMRLISRLVAKAFVPREDGKDEVDHKNRNCKDDRAENLRWVNRSENLQNTKDRGTKTGERCIYKTPVAYLVQIVRNSKVVYRKNFNTLQEAIQNRNHFLNTYNQVLNQN